MATLVMKKTKMATLTILSGQLLDKLLLHMNGSVFWARLQQLQYGSPLIWNSQLAEK